jgi:GNAT superfamily N-acetyltransferase
MHTYQVEEEEIRLASLTEISAILAIIEQTWEPTYKTILSLEQVRFMQAEIYNPAALETQMVAGQKFLILYWGGQPAGFAAYSPEEPGTFKLNKLYVDPAFQGKKIGQRLLERVEQEARQQGGRFLLLNVNRFNKAKTFYEKQGYSILREEDIPIGDFWMNDYVLQKAL